MGMKSAQRQENRPTVRFKAVLGTKDFLLLPKSASAKLPFQGATAVEGIMDSFPFRSALANNDKKGYAMKISAALRSAANARIGDTVSLEITRIGDEPETRVPRDLRDALQASPSARDLWTNITPMARREWVLWIGTAKQEETRARRIEKACDMLASGKRRVCCFGGIAWLTRDHTAAETWAKL